MQYTTPLRYPGGKSRLAGFVKLVFETNTLVGRHYIEPYAGGAGLAFHLLFSGHASHIHINDLSKSIYAFWYSVIENTDSLCRLICDTPVNINSWQRQRNIQNRHDQHSILELGFSTFFLNRTNRSGIVNGGVIGGKRQDSNYKLDARYNKIDLISRIERIARYKDRISVYNKDALKFMSETLPALSQECLVYLDPPYYAKGHALYENYYGHNDHYTIYKFLTTIGQPWIVTYDNVAEIREIYRGYQHMCYEPFYSAAKHYKGSEIMFFCDSLIVPPVDHTFIDNLYPQ